MNILIIDHDEISSELVYNKLLSLGCTVVYETSKSDATVTISKQDFDAVLIDPSPVTEAQQVILNIKKAARNNPYILLMSPNAQVTDASGSGANDTIQKAINLNELETKVTNIARLKKLTDKIGDASEDFPNSGGVIAKSAFNQLFLSSIERADRYAESSFVLFISIKNHEQIIEEGGVYSLGHSVAKLAQHIVTRRRLSDIIAQTGQYEYALLLQRPHRDAEVLKAAERFADTLSECKDITAYGMPDVRLSVSLVELPTGALLAEHIFTSIQGTAKPIEQNDTDKNGS